MKKISTLGSALLMAAVLSACGGGGSDGGGTATSTGSGTGGGSSGSGSSSACSGSSWLTPSYDVYAAGSASATSQAATYYGASMSASGQCIAVANTLQATTSDGFATISWSDPVGTALNGWGAARFDQNLLLTCAAGSDATRHLAVRTGAGAAVFNGSQARIMVSNLYTFQSLECGSNGQSVNSGQTQLNFGVDKSATLLDSGTPTSFTASQVDQLFSSTGLTLGNGTVLRWTLYVVPVGALTKQVIVHTGSKPDGTVNVFAFLQS
jgi:hypothetical protein